MDEIIGKAVAIEVSKRGSSAERGNPSRDAFKTRMHLAHELVRWMVRDLRQRKSFETEAASKGGDFRRGQRGKFGDRVTNGCEDDCSKTAEILIHRELRY
ncbi:MAG TPA: hypothetical protein VFD27_18770 [Chthoniobacteraceae bacterium]|nr:hypothetical protein [Chthoniobacteraceae bacterium]